MDKEMKLGKPSVIDGVEIDFGHEDTPIQRSGGRPPKTKHLTTIFKEQMRGQFEKRMKKDFQYVMDSVVEHARDGNIQAAKLLFDRVIPTNKAIDSSQVTKIPEITINIGSLEDEKPKIVSEQ
jgi:hypothetical protein